MMYPYQKKLPSDFIDEYNKIVLIHKKMKMQREFSEEEIKVISKINSICEESPKILCFKLK